MFFEGNGCNNYSRFYIAPQAEKVQVSPIRISELWQSAADQNQLPKVKRPVICRLIHKKTFACYVSHSLFYSACC